MPLPNDVRKRLLSLSLAAAVSAPEFVELPPQEPGRLLLSGEWWALYAGTLTSPTPRYEVDYTYWDQGAPTVRTIQITWVTGTRYSVTVDGTVVHDGTNPVNNVGFPTISVNDWNFYQTTTRIIGYAYRIFSGGAYAATKILLTHVEGMPRFGSIGVGLSATVPGGGGDGVNGYFYNPGLTTVTNLMIRAADLSGPRIKFESQGGRNYDGLVFQHLEFGPPNDSITLWSNAHVYGNADIVAGQEQRNRVFEDCKFAVAPFDDTGVSWKAKFRNQRWGIRSFNDYGLVVRNCEFGDSSEMRVWEEHCFYLSNMHGYVVIIGNRCCFTGRTTLQLTNRMIESDVQEMISGHAIVVFANNVMDGGYGDGSGNSGGSTVTIAGHLGPVYVDGCEILPWEEPSDGTWVTKAGGILGWPGSFENVYLTEDGFAVLYMFLGLNVINNTAPGGVSSRECLRFISVREVDICLGPGTSYQGSPTARFDFDYSVGGTGNAGQPPVLQEDGVTRVVRVESKTIRLFDAYTPGVTAPSVVSGAANCVFTEYVSGVIVERPAGNASNGTVITQLLWEYNNPLYL